MNGTCRKQPNSDVWNGFAVTCEFFPLKSPQNNFDLQSSKLPQCTAQEVTGAGKQKPCTSISAQDEKALTKSHNSFFCRFTL